MPSLRKQKIQLARARKKSYLRKTKKQREDAVRVSENKAKAHRKMIREALGFDKIKLKRKEVEKTEFEKAASQQIKDKFQNNYTRTITYIDANGNVVAEDDPYWEFTPTTRIVNAYVQKIQSNYNS